MSIFVYIYYCLSIYIFEDTHDDVNKEIKESSKWEEEQKRFNDLKAFSFFVLLFNNTIEKCNIAWNI